MSLSDADRQKLIDQINANADRTLANSGYYIKDPTTGEVLQKYSNATEAFQAGAIKSPSAWESAQAKIYKNSTGAWTYKAPYTAKVSLNKSTGDIDLQVPDATLGSTEFQNSELVQKLKAAAAAYKADPNALLNKSDQQGKATGETITVEDWVESLNEPTSEMVDPDNPTKKVKVSTVTATANYYAQLAEREKALGSRFRVLTEDGEIVPLRFTEADIMRLQANGLGDDVKDTDRIALPRNFKGLEKAYSASSWDEKSGTIEIKDFLENVYNLDQYGETESGERVISNLHSDLERYLAERMANPAVDGTADQEQITGALALYNYMNEKSPSCNWWTGASYALSAPLKGVLGEVAKDASNAVYGMWAVTGLVNVLPLMLVNGAQWLEYRVSGGKKDFKWRWPWEERATDGSPQMTWVTDLPNQFQEAREVLDVLPAYLDGKGDWDKAIDDAMSSLNKDIEEEVARLKEFNQRMGGSTGDFSLSAMSDAIAGISGGIYRLIEIIAIGNAFESIVASGMENAATNASVTAESILQAAQTPEALTGAASKIVSLIGAENAANLYNNLAAIASSPLAIAPLKVVFETIGEGLVQDPDRLQEVLANGLLSEDGIVYMGETLLGNAVGGALGWTVAKGAMKVGDTTIARAASAKIRAKVWAIQGRVADSLDSLRTRFGKYPTIKEWIDEVRKTNPDKASALSLNRLIRRKRQEIVAETGEILAKDKDEIVKALDKLDSAVSELQEMENAIDNFQRQSILQIRDWQYGDDNPLFKATNQKLTTLSGKIMRAEAQAGLESAAKTTAGALFSQATTDYIGASVRVPILQNIVENVKNLSSGDKKAIAEEIAYWTAAMADYEAKATPELLNLVKTYTNDYKQWWYQANNIFTKAGTIDPDDIEAWRNSGQWGKQGELYARLQRQTELSQYFVKRADGRVDAKLSRELGHYGYGNTDSFVDPHLVMQQELRVNADIKLRNDAIRAFSGSKGPTVIYDAAHTKLRTQVAPKLNSFNKESKETLKEVVNQLDTAGVFEEEMQRELIRMDLANVEKQTRQIAKAKAPRGSVTAMEQQTLITVMTDSEIDSLFGLITDEQSVDDIIGELNTGSWGRQVKGEIKDQLRQLKAQGEIASDALTPENLALARQANPDLDSTIKRAYLMNDSRVANEPYVKELIQDTRETRFIEDMYAAYEEGIAAQMVLGEGLTREKVLIQEATDKLFDTFSDTFYGKRTLASIIGDDVAQVYSDGAPEVVKKFIMLDAMRHNRTDIAKSIQDKAFDYFSKLKIDGKTMSAARAKSLSKQMGLRFNQQINLQFNQARAVLSETGDKAKALIDAKSWQKEIRDEAEKIGAKLTEDNFILMRNAAGEFETIEIDPLLADFVGTKAAGRDLSKAEKLNYLWMRLFRMGTTGISPRSMLNQYFRDLGNAWILGNVNATIKTNQKILGQVFGDNVAEVLAQYSDEAQDAFERLAKEQNRSIQEVLAESEIARGRRVAEAGTETADMRLYRETRNMWYQGDARAVQSTGLMDRSVDKVTDTLGGLNEVRETYLRDLVYSNSYTKAIKQGKSIQQARIYAEYIANNATTNFVRQTTFLSHMQRSIPYLRSAINGTKSFWRLWSLDPVGVTGRIFGGYIIPTIGLISASMNGEENLKTYKNIPEYRKESALPLVVNGEYFSIPIPQELSALINPVRHAIEAFHGMHEGAGLEIIINDIFAFSPLDLSGFTDIDSINMFKTSEGVDWTERFFDGSTKLFAQLAPKWLSAAAGALSGRDLYTGKKIDTSHVVTDPETGATQQMSYTAGALATKIAEIFPGTSAVIAQEFLNNFFGDATPKMLDWAISTAENVAQGIFDEEVSFTEVFEKQGATNSEFAEWVLTPVHPFIQDEVDKAWRGAISELWDKKYALFTTDEWQNYLKLRDSATTQAERDAAATARANVLNPFYAEVQTVVNNLTQAYGSTLTPQRFASVLSLMNMYVETGDANVIMQDSNKSSKQQGKNAAVDTMIRLGFSSTSDASIWGQIRTSSNGGTYIQYSTPLQILQWDNMQYSQGAFYEADLSRLLKQSNITYDAYQEANNQYKAETDKNKKKALAAAWDVKVAMAIAPYVQQYGADNVINANAVLDLLDQYLIIPSDFMRYNGKSTYNPNVEIKRAYARSLLKNVFRGL